MTTQPISDGLLKAALAPVPMTIDLVDMAEAVSSRIRTAPQRRRHLPLPWLPSPAATLRDVRRARLVRLALVAMLVAAAVGVVAAGARLLPPPDAPPQWLLLRQGQPFSVPYQGGERRPLVALSGLQITDMSLSWNGRRLATLRGVRNEILEIWNAAEVFGDRGSTPVRFTLPDGILVFGAGVWRRDDAALLFDGRDRGAVRIFSLDLATGAFTQLTPTGINVDDWQPSPDGRWLEVVGQKDGQMALYIVDLTTNEFRPILTSNDVDVPVGGALGWSPDSQEMTVRLERRVVDGGIWAIRPDGTGKRRLTPPGQQAWWMSWSPDGAWIMYLSLNPDQTCTNHSISGEQLMDTWVVRADGTDADVVAAKALPMEWSDDSRSVLVESQLARPDAPHGGVIRAFVDGSPAELVYPYTELDGPTGLCHTYGVWTKRYRGVSHGNR